MNSKRLSTQVKACAFAAAGVFGASCSWNVPSSSEPTSETLLAADQHARSGANSNVVPTGIARHEKLSQTVEFVVDEATGIQDSVIIETREWDSVSSSWCRTSQRERATFAITRVRARIAGDLFVLGEHSGVTILERWKMSPPKGAYEAARPVAATAIGVPYPMDVPTVVTVVGGGSWTLPNMRSKTGMGLKRSLLLQRTPANPIRVMEIDPDGRFVLFTDNAGFRQLDLSANAGTVPAIAIDWSTLSQAAQQISSLVVKQSSTQGRAFIGRVTGQPFSVDYALVLLDSDNDGVFESVQELTYEGLEMNFPFSEWTRDF